MNKSPLRRRMKLQADPATTREWLDRSRKPLERKAEMPKRGPKYRARHAVQFASQADLCRHLPCCACHPWLYEEELAALDFERKDRISDPHHIHTRRTADDSATVPLCMGPNGHHAKCSAVGWSAKRVQDEAGVEFAVVAERLARYLAATRTAVEESIRRPMYRGSDPG